jgi:hypothetical protein
MAGFQDLLKYWDLTRNIPEGREDAALKPEPSELVHWIQEAGLVERLNLSPCLVAGRSHAGLEVLVSDQTAVSEPRPRRQDGRLQAARHPGRLQQ